MCIRDSHPLHDGLFDSEQGRPYRGAAHAVLRSHRFRTFRQPRTYGRTACCTLSRSDTTHGDDRRATFCYLRHYTCRRVVLWLRAKHRKASWKSLRRRYTRQGWWPEQDGIALFDPGAVKIVRYRYRGAAIPTPWTQPVDSTPAGLA